MNTETSCIITRLKFSKRYKSEDTQLDLSLFLQLIAIMSETAQVLPMEFAKQQTFVSVIQDLLVTETLGPFIRGKIRRVLHKARLK